MWFWQLRNVLAQQHLRHKSLHLSTSWGRQSTKPLHSALLHACFIHLQWNESQLQENSPLWCGRGWPHLQDLMLKTTEETGKGGKKYFYIESKHSQRFVDWRKSFCSLQRSILLEEILSEFSQKQLYDMSNSGLSLKYLSIQIFRNFEIPAISELSICVIASTHFRKTGLRIASSKRKF